MMKIGIGYDVHQLVEGRPLIIGGVTIPFEKGLLGHSDADVLTHAIMDAILGALALGSIGDHFPDTDAAFKDADSLILLDRTVELMTKAGYKIGNVDSVIMAQRPKMKPHIQAIRDTLANRLLCDVGSVGVKATTTEKLGFVGREEGFASEAVVLLVPINA